MSSSVAFAGFVGGAIVSLVTSFILVSRLERVGERLGLSEALLGMVAALAADAPEVSAAVTAVATHEQRVGAGVVVGSNVFNLAALLGLGAVVAGRIGLHRKVVALGGTVALGVAGVCLAVVFGVLPALAGLLLGLAVLGLYLVVLGHDRLTAVLPRRWVSWLRSAVAEEEIELEQAIRPRRGRWQDVAAAVGALLVVIGASAAMERSAVTLGARYAVPEIVIGGLVLAAVTSLPNAVAAVYLARRGRGAATLSTALNSNTLNVVAGLLLPAAVLGLGRPSGQTVLITVWYAALMAAVLAFAYRDRGLGRAVGAGVIAAYAAFTVSVLAAGNPTGHSTGLIAALGAAAGLAAIAGLAAPWLAGRRRHRAAIRQVRTRPASSWLSRASLLPGWSARRVLLAGFGLSALIAATDAALGPHVVLIGLLIVGPCCALLTGRWMLTALAGLWVIGLAVLLGVPDGIWGTSMHLAFLGAVGTVSVVSTAAAAVLRNSRPGPGGGCPGI
jgi:cation:H+ antiporter